MALRDGPSNPGTTLARAKSTFMLIQNVSAEWTCTSLFLFLPPNRSTSTHISRTHENHTCIYRATSGRLRNKILHNLSHHQIRKSITCKTCIARIDCTQKRRRSDILSYMSSSYDFIQLNPTPPPPAKINSVRCEKRGP